MTSLVLGAGGSGIILTEGAPARAYTFAVIPEVTGSIANQSYNRGIAISTLSLSTAVTGETTGYALAASSDQLPSGLSLNTSTGDITGTPLESSTLAEPFNISVEVSGTGGTASSTIDFTISVDAIQITNLSITATGITFDTDENNGTTYISAGAAPTEAEVIAGTETYNWNFPVTSSGGSIEIDLTAEVGNSIDIGVVQVAADGERSDFIERTETIQASKPAVFVDAMWSVATGSGGSELDVTISSLPGNGGGALTAIEYDVDGNDTWTSVGGTTTGTYTITMAAASTSYAIRLRAVNANGNASAGNSESATSGASASNLTYLAHVSETNDFGSTPEDFDLGGSALTGLANDSTVVVGIVLGGGQDPLATAVTIGGVTATLRTESSSGSSLDISTAIWEATATGAFASNIVNVTPDAALDDSLVVAYDATGLTFQTGLGGSTSTNGGTTDQTVNTTCSASDQLLGVAGSFANNGSETFTAGVTDDANAPVAFGSARAGCLVSTQMPVPTKP